MRLIQITDLHVFADPDKVGYDGVKPFHSLQAVLRDVASQSCELLLITGDISGDGSNESYQHIKYLLREHLPRTQVQMIPGNHDDQSILAQLFNENMLHAGQPLFLGTWVVHGLNSAWQEGGAKGKVSEEQLRLLSAAVAANEGHHLLAVHHHPIPVEGWMDSHEWINREAFWETVRQLNEVKVCIHGHIHTARELRCANLDVLATPSTCWQFATTPDFAVESQSPVRGPAYRILDLGADGQVCTAVHYLN